MSWESHAIDSNVICPGSDNEIHVSQRPQLRQRRPQAAANSQIRRRIFVFHKSAKNIWLAESAAEFLSHKNQLKKFGHLNKTEVYYCLQHIHL